MRVIAFLMLAPFLAGCGPARPTAAGGKSVSYWVEVLKSPDAKLRKQAAFKLGNVGPADAATIPALLAALNDADARVRAEAIVALVKCGPEARGAVPVLAEVRRRDRDAHVRASAALALAKLQ